MREGGLPKQKDVSWKTDINDRVTHTNGLKQHQSSPLADWMTGAWGQDVMIYVVA